MAPTRVWMNRRIGEVQAVQNPALGAVLLWRFSCAFCPDGAVNGTPLPLLFVVLPIVFHSKTFEEVRGTLGASGLRQFELKFHNKSDLLLALHSRMLVMRDLSLASVRIAVHAKLITLVPSQGVVWPQSRSSPPADSQTATELIKGAERLGRWCRDVSLFEVSALLKVDF